MKLIFQALQWEKTVSRWIQKKRRKSRNSQCPKTSKIFKDFWVSGTSTENLLLTILLSLCYSSNLQKRIYYSFRPRLNRKYLIILKKIFTSILCLVIFKLGKLVRIEIDISDKKIEIYILQQNKKKQYSIIYILKKIILAELNYNIYNKKLLAIIAIFQI